MVSVGTPARNLSSVRSKISEGGVSSINWTNGSMASEYWTGCGIGMVCFSLSAVMWALLPLLVFNLDSPHPLLSQRERQGSSGLLHFPGNRPARFANCQRRRTHQGYAPEAPLSSFAGGDAFRFPVYPAPDTGLFRVSGITIATRRVAQSPTAGRPRNAASLPN